MVPTGWRELAGTALSQASPQESTPPHSLNPPTRVTSQGQHHGPQSSDRAEEDAPSGAGTTQGSVAMPQVSLHTRTCS